MCFSSNTIGIAELNTLAALASYALFITMCFTTRQNIEQALWGNSCWQNRTSQSYTKQQRQMILEIEYING
jgi:hypothetical protein